MKFKKITLRAIVIGSAVGLGIAFGLETAHDSNHARPRKEIPGHAWNIDLNGDGKQDIIKSYDKLKLTGRHYYLTARLSNPDGTYQSPKLLKKFKMKPEKIEFKDMDSDGDLDLVFIRNYQPYINMDISRQILNPFEHNYKTYMLPNDGKGNFGKKKLIRSKRK